MERKSMINRMMDLLKNFEAKEDRPYNPTEYGTGRVFDSYYAGKTTPIMNGMSLLEAFERHPAYDGDGKIVLSEKMYRSIDRKAIKRFCDWVVFVAPRSDFYVGQMVIIKSGEGVVDYTGSWTKEMNKYIEKEMKVSFVSDDGSYINVEDTWQIFDTRYVDAAVKPEVEGMNRNQINFFKSVLTDYPQYCDESQTETINEIFPFLKAHNGAKTSRLINKILKHYGIFDNARFTNFADAINPLAITRWTILSINPIDYLTMSFGNTWSSCHTIDKTNIRNTNGRHYSGMYSAGTTSYMLDSTSFVMYTVDSSYKGTNYELQDKINRQMFHVGREKLVQGRLYPNDQEGSGTQDTSETLELYKQFREIAQRVISECFGVTNYWSVVKGTSICESIIVSEGVNYPDYYHYSNCNISFLKREDGGRNETQMIVGKLPICFECGEEYEDHNCIVCNECLQEYTCERCGEPIREVEGIETADGHHYCSEDCAINDDYVRCENDCEWHRANSRYVMYDDYDGEYYYDEYGFPDRVDVDVFSFINAIHANCAGYVLTYDGEWRLRDDVYMCSDCHRYFESKDFNHELCICNRCAETRTEEETA